VWNGLILRISYRIFVLRNRYNLRQMTAV